MEQRYAYTSFDNYCKIASQNYNFDLAKIVALDRKRTQSVLGSFY